MEQHCILYNLDGNNEDSSQDLHFTSNTVEYPQHLISIPLVFFQLFFDDRPNIFEMTKKN